MNYHLLLCYLIFNCLIYSFYCNDEVNDDINYLKEKVKFIIFDDFHIGPDNKSILDILLIDNKIPKDNVYYLTENIPNKYPEDTLLLPILFRYVKESINNDFDWFFIINSFTRFDPILLNKLLFNLNKEQTIFEKIQNISHTNNNIKSPNNNFIGAKINDVIPSIVHHYNLDKNFQYPFHYSGYAIRRFTIESLQVSIKSLNSIDIKNYSKIYTDVNFELAKLIYDELNIKLKDIPEFCINIDDTNPKYHKKGSIVPKKCITWSISYRISNNCVSFSLPLNNLNPKYIVNPNEIVIAIKTTQKYHHDRISQINQLWANTKYLNYNSINSNPYCNDYFNSISHLFKPFNNKSIHINILSDHNDYINDIPINDLKTGNQPSGHCLKFYTIIHFLYNKYIINNLNLNYKIKYFVLVDDDTLIIPFSLLNSLTFINQQYSDKNDFDLYLGLRYSLGSIIDNWSVDYITGGGGIVINSNSLSKLANCKECICNKPDEPDDMALGRWFKFLNIKAINFNGFHQAESTNYHSYYNFYSHIISYHKIESNIYNTAQKYNPKLFNLLYPHINDLSKYKENSDNKYDEL
ncbi:uncharacterized protein cubi_01746 [Cryptosporidium ubiquitum]|uniref:Fringe-like glycosyltransferase domain-containing protein n=1 Tax=Cryptosporidium ubiquitum TaxID=857276 RepID=A0A1J4MBA7_9CRYT|nr:uncharacterized protein cubi_01746 [Cryptosporidium ubiquitum]OII71271.1 hypothetical protein cubi_01746 [Cryptosporidium ubiquitum]